MYKIIFGYPLCRHCVYIVLWGGFPGHGPLLIKNRPSRLAENTVFDFWQTGTCCDWAHCLALLSLADKRWPPSGAQNPQPRISQISNAQKNKASSCSCESRAFSKQAPPQVGVLRSHSPKTVFSPLRTFPDFFWDMLSCPTGPQRSCVWLVAENQLWFSAETER